MSLDDHVVQRSLHLPARLRERGLRYTIVWGEEEGMIIAKETRGQHPFLHASKRFAFRMGQGYVGRIIKDHCEAVSEKGELLSNMLEVDQHSFLRKQAALTSGISSIIFMGRRDGSLLELGFESLGEAGESWSLLRSEGSREGRQLLSLFQLRGVADAWSPARPRRPLDWEGGGKRGRERSASPGSNVDSSGSSTRPSSQEPPNITYFCRTPSPSPEPSIYVRQPRLSALTAALAAAPPPPEQPELVPPPPEPVEARPIMSIGSVGHPHNCRAPCKYAGKPKGCKDGPSCIRCHFCLFTRARQRAAKEQLQGV